LGQKLPILYLVDSICKLVGQPYISLFARNIASIFRQTFSAFSSGNDTDNVQRLIRLQNTWKNYVPLNSAGQPTAAGGPVFPSTSLAPMDELILEWEQDRLRENLAKEQPPLPPPLPAHLPDVPHPLPLPALLQMITMTLNSRQEQVVHLQQSGQYSHVPIAQQQAAALSQLLHYIQNPHLLPTPEAQTQISRQIHQLFTAEFPNMPIPLPMEPPLHQPIHPSRLAMFQPPLIPHPAPMLHVPDEHVQSRKRSRSPSPPPRATTPVYLVPDVDLTTEGILHEHRGIHQLLYDGLSMQCKQCALRFASSADGKEKMDAHLDMHFRQNRSIKQGKDEKSRDWYVLQTVWEQPERADVQQEETEQVVIDPQSLKPVKAPSEGTLKCSICRDGFVKFWDDDEEEWMLRDAVEWNAKVVNQRVILRELTLHRLCIAFV